MQIKLFTNRNFRRQIKLKSLEEFKNSKMKFIHNFCIPEEDLENVNKKRNKNLLIAEIIILTVVLALLGINLYERRIYEELKLNTNYYLIHTIIAAVNLCFLGIITICFKKHRKLNSLPVYFLNLTYLTLNVWDLYHGGYFYTSYMTFAVHGIICCILFDMNPVIWTFFVAGVVAAYAHVDTEILRFLNILIYATAVVILCWWKRYNLIQSLIYTKNLAREKQKNEELLLNILPAKILEELKQTGKTVPEKFDEASILFTDFAGFTKTSKDLSPETVISELNEIFTAFDQISEKYGVTRIKTIGDSYFAVCGLPEKCSDHAERIVNCGIEFIKYLENRNENSKIKWQMRVGINSGEVTAGIVGTKKYLYDIFGDTVNTASRMESNSIPMRINVSEATRNLLGDKFNFTKREPVTVKGKGPMTMYFVDF